MTVKTHFTENDMLEILSNYNLGDLVKFNAITTGTVQTNLFLKTSQGRYVFRYYECRSKNSVLFEVNLINYLQQKKYPCPAPFKDKHGRYIGLYRKKPYAVFEFVEGRHIKNPTWAQKKQLIKRAAQLQKITGNYRSLYAKYRWNYSAELCRKLAQKEAQRIGTRNSELKYKWLKKELGRLQLPPSLPKGICHCDFHFSNVLFKRDKFAALIDFDDANYTYLVFDLVWLMNPFLSSFAWNSWRSFKKTEDLFDFRESRKTVSEYMRYRHLNNNEKRHLFDVYKLSVLLDCVWYFERGRTGDFFEKRKIDCLNALGREAFYDQVFCSHR